MRETKSKKRRIDYEGIFCIYTLNTRLTYTRKGGILLMILSFGDKETEKVFNGTFSTKLPVDIQHTANRKMCELNRARRKEDVVNPPGNHLEKLYGDGGNYYSIRINKQWRICFIPVDEWSNFVDVSIIDYH